MHNPSESSLQSSNFKHLSGENVNYKFAEISIEENRNFNEIVDKFRLNIINNALKDTDNNFTKAAKKLGLSRQNLSQIYKRLVK